MPRLDESVATSVYAVSVDSRSRPPEQPDNKYTISLGRTLDRVKSVQLGSIQIPDCRYAFDAVSALHYCEPLTILPNTHVFIQETTHTCNKVDYMQSTSTRTIQIALPPTLNRIVNYVDTPATDADVLVTEYDAGLDFGIKYYPTVNLTMKVIGAHFPQSLMTLPMPPFPPTSGPVLGRTTVQSQPDGYYGPPSATESPDKSIQYAAGYLDALTTSAGNYPQRHVLFDGTPCLVAWSYIAAPKVTMVELFTMLNAALAEQALLGQTQVTGSIVNVVAAGAQLLVTTAVNHALHSYDQVVISGVNGIPGANGTFFIDSVPSSTTFLITPTSVAGAYINGGAYTSPRGILGIVQFGFNDVNNAIQATAPSIVRETRTTKTTISYTLAPAPNGGAVSLAAYLGFGTQSLEPPATARVPDYIIRSVMLRAGNYNPLELCAAVNVRWNPLTFGLQQPAARTLNYVLPTGTPASLVIPPGRFTPGQFVDFLNFNLNPAPAQIGVTYNPVTGKFLFSHLLGLQFGLDFSDVTSTLLALQLGFKPVGYSGSSSYLSFTQAVYGVPASAPAGINTFPSNTYAMWGDDTQSKFTFDTGDPPQFITNSSVYDTTGCPYVASWNPQYNCASSEAGLPWQANDVLSAAAPFYYAAVTGASLTAPITITVALPHGLSNGDSVTISCVGGNDGANGTWTVANVAANTFQLVGSAGTALYIAGTGTVTSNSFSGVATNTYQVVVAAPVNYALPAPPSLQLQPTVSIFSTLNAGTVNEALLQPSATRRIVMQSAARDVFQLFFSHPSAKPSNFGFPAISWPPSAKALQLFHGGSLPTYDPILQAVPVSNSYTSPFCWNLLPPDYILMVLCAPTGSKDAHTHCWNGKNRSIFAKLYITSPYLNIADQMQFVTFAGYQRMNQVSVEFQNPDGSLVEFNGRPHNYELLFTLYENTAETNCF
jgi:hypothetical protein